MVQSAEKIFTIGHSTRTWDEFVRLLKAHGVRGAADVRKYPGSRRLPWFGAAVMTEALPQAGLKYLPFPDLGGRRRPTGETTNAAWRNESFRGYADYMQTPPFAAALERLMQEAAKQPLALMCAEAVPWRCHRSLIADALLVRGWQILDILDTGKATPHRLTPFAHVDGRRITYPPPTDNAELFAQQPEERPS